MRVAVLGCGAIGGLILGYLSRKDVDITGIVKRYQRESFSLEGLRIEGVRGSQVYEVRVDTRLKEKVDLAIVATKIDDIEDVVVENNEFIKDATVLTTQNGVRADYILEKYFLPRRIITGIVMFGATFQPPNRIVHNFEGDFILGNIFGEEVKDLEKVREVLNKAFRTRVLENIQGAKYLKVFVNLNNCIPAILGVSMQEAFGDLDISELAIRLNKEAYYVVEKSRIELQDLPGYPEERLRKLLSMETKQAASIFSQIMTSLSKEPLYGSILQSIKRGKKSEVDYINGEIVRLASHNNMEASLNRKIVSLVHRVEASGKFLTRDELLKEVA